MDLRRISLFAGLAILTYLMIFQWSKDYGQTTTMEGPSVSQSETVVKLNDNSDIVSNSIEFNSSDITLNDDQSIRENKDIQRIITVQSPTLNIEIDLEGGDIVSAKLPQYPYSINTPDVPFTMLSNQSMTYVAQSGLSGKDGIDSNGRPLYKTDAVNYVLDTENTLEVVLEHTTDSGIEVKKIYTFSVDSYLIGLRFEVHNKSAKTIELDSFAQIKRDRSKDPSNSEGFGMSSYLGATFSTENSAYEKVEFDDLDDQPFNQTSHAGWVAFLQHYFLTAWIPSESHLNQFYGKQRNNNLYYYGYETNPIKVLPNQIEVISSNLYIGPKIQKNLEEIAPHLGKTVDYGWLWIISNGLFWLLNAIHSMLGNWGWSIVILTLLLKTILYPLTVSSYRSAAKMRKFAPKIKELRDRYGSDRQKLSQEMMKLYSSEKVNPIGGCLPMLLQMPIFIALYWVLQESVELRQSPFIFWIVDLSIKDPYFVLPLLMGGSMYLQMQMQQQPAMDPMQVKMLKLMPVIFTFMFLWFPAGLTLYWFVNNVVTILQQYFYNKKVEAEG